MKIDMRKTALVVEDSSTMRQMVCCTLRSAGYRILEASHGQDALRTIAEEAHVDVLMTDLHMPEMDGISLIKEIRKIASLRQPPSWC